MNDTDQAFFDLANDMLAAEANDLLDKQLAAVVAWREDMQRQGERCDLRALQMQVRDELRRDPRRLGPIMSAFNAALWRLLEKDDRL